MMIDKKLIAYELMTALLALVSAFIVGIDFFDVHIPKETLDVLLNIDNLIYYIFVVDYVVRLAKAKEKKKFIKNNIIDLISIIPFNAILKSLRILKLNKLLRLVKLLKMSTLLARFKDDIDKFFRTNYFGYVLITTVVIVLSGALLVSSVEKISIGDSIWWSIVTTATVGYGDIYPSTALGRIVAVVLMMVGIGFIGILTSTISRYCISLRRDKLDFKDEVILNIKNKLDRFEELSVEEIDDIYFILKALKIKE